MNPVLLTFDYASFVVIAPAYSDPIRYPQATLQAFWNSAINYISNVGNYGQLQDGARQYAINLMTAHLVYISGLIASGTVPYLMQNSTIDKVSIGLTPPKLNNQFQWWLSVSPYGQQLLALLQVNSVGGFYIGGSPQRAAFGFQGGFIGIPGRVM
jgi:hypothetical protein